MSIQAAQLYALVGVQGAGQSIRDLQGVSNQVNATQGTMAKLGANLNQMGKGFGQIGQGAIRVAELGAVALVGITVASAKLATTFQAQMELVHTQAGASQAEVALQSRAILDLAHSVGSAPIEMAKALYHIESVGVRGAAALDVLKAGALGAKVGLADMETTTNALTAVSFSAIGGVKNMAEAMGVLNAIVGTGNMRMTDLVQSFSTGILGTSKTFGVGLKELGAALAVLSDAGVPAQVAGTRLSMTWTHMAVPVKGAIAVMNKLGLSQFQLANDMRKPNGVFLAFKDLHDALAKVGEIKGGVLSPQGAADVSKIFGGSRFGATAMQLLAQYERIDLKYKAIVAGQGSFADAVARTMETASFKVGQLKADLQTSAIDFGTAVLPSLARAIGHIDMMLVGRRGDITKFGTELGTAIDKIDWTKVERGLGMIIDDLKIAFGILQMLPPEVIALGASFLVVNKLSGGLIGAGIGNVAAGAGKLVGNLAAAGLRAGLSRVPVVGGALSAATATPVYIVGAAPGVFGGLAGAGGPGAVLAGGGSGGLIGKLLKFGAALSLAAIAVDLWQNTLVPLNDANAQQTRDIGAAVQAGIKTATTDQLTSERGALLDGLNAIFGTTSALGPLQGVLYGAQIDAMKVSIAAIDAELAGRSSGPSLRDSQRGGVDSTVVRGLQTMGDDFRATEYNTASIARDMRALHAVLVSEFHLQGGQVLREAMKKGHGEIVRKAHDLLQLFSTSAAPSLLSMKGNLEVLKTLQRQGDTATRAALGADIRSLQSHIDAVTAAVQNISFPPSLRDSQRGGRDAGPYPGNPTLTPTQQSQNSREGNLHVSVTTPGIAPYLTVRKYTGRFGPAVRP